MSMQHYPNSGYLVHLTEENIRKFEKIDEEVLNDFVEVCKTEIDLEDNQGWESFREEFYKHYGIYPDWVYIDEECEGLDGGAELGISLHFVDEDKYIRTINPKWSELPIEPEESCWASFG